MTRGPAAGDPARAAGPVAGPAGRPGLIDIASARPSPAARHHQGEGTHVESRTGTAVGGTAHAEPVSVPELLARSRTLCTPPLKAAVARLAAPMDTVAAYHFGWIDRDGTPAAGTAARPSGPPWHCSPPRPSAPRRRPECLVGWRLNWCTTSPCSMMI